MTVSLLETYAVFYRHVVHSVSVIHVFCGPDTESEAGRSSGKFYLERTGFIFTAYILCIEHCESFRKPPAAVRAPRALQHEKIVYASVREGSDILVLCVMVIDTFAPFVRLSSVECSCNGII